MSVAKIRFAIITPDQILVESEARLIVIPGIRGDIGALPGIGPIITELRPGAVVWFQGDGVENRVFVGGGVAEASPNGVDVLASSAEFFDDIDMVELRVALSQATGAQKRILTEKLTLVNDPPYPG